MGDPHLPDEQSEQVQVRRQKLTLMREAGFQYPNAFRPGHHSQMLIDTYGDQEADALNEAANEVSIAGRMMRQRVMGKSTFLHLQDEQGMIQVFLNQGQLGEDAYQATKKWDLGDLIGVHGVVFKTKTGELSVKATSVVINAKCLHPLPEKWKGLTDKEIRYRQRYLDLMVNPEVRHVFQTRSKVINSLRKALVDEHFTEVETPMLQVQPGGAAARPFVTHHHALDIDLYMRIAPELYLKRLIVGGFERVFEINRNFRNEGIDATHNPEFTMLEFYQAYADVDDAIERTESLVKSVASDLQIHTVEWDGIQLDLKAPFKRIRMDASVFEKRPDLVGHAGNKALLATACLQEIPDFKAHITWKAGHYLTALFEHLVEQHIEQPTFITHYPVDVSPLARRNADEPDVTDRFELIIAGKEIANGFSELNDPDDQRQRFMAQANARKAGDLEAAPMDEDYLQALEYGMAPTAGVGIGVDRLVMMLTGQHSIRDVLLFPHMRPRLNAAIEIESVEGDAK